MNAKTVEFKKLVSLVSRNTKCYFKDNLHFLCPLLRRLYFSFFSLRF